MKIDTANDGGSRAGDLEQPSVTNNPSKQRYEIQIGSEVVGFAAYELVGDSVMFTHTEIASMYDGRGYGGMLARLAIEDVRMQAKQVIQCARLLQRLSGGTPSISISCARIFG